VSSFVGGFKDPKDDGGHRGGGDQARSDVDNSFSLAGQRRY
jgi:hypothetical protein